MNAITHAGLLASTNLTSPAAADGELISLGRLFDDALVRERAAWDAVTDECEDDDPAAVLADTLNDETGVIVDQIELHAATTLSGLLIKARVMEWCRSALPGQPVTITDFDDDPHPSAYTKILVALLNDLNTMARGEPGHSRSRARILPTTPSADPALTHAVEQFLVADRRYDHEGFHTEPGCNEHVETWDERLAVVSNAPGSTMADFAEKARALVASIQREINPIDRDLDLPPSLAMALRLAQDLITAGARVGEPSATSGRVHAYRHRLVVRLELGAEVARVWLLDEDASIATMTRGIVFDTLDYVLGGVAVLLLSNRPELVGCVRREMLEAIAVMHPSVKSVARAKVEREMAA